MTASAQKPSERSLLGISLALFALGAWPTWIVDLPPFQDLPNHVASAAVQLHPDRYPELVSNGFFKTNSMFFLFMHVVGGAFGLRLAAKLFVMVVLGVGAFVYPRAVARLGSGNVYSASFFAWPFVHNWFVSMGMLDFALAVPLALATLVVLDAHRRTPTLARSAAAALLGGLVWYTHAFVFMIMCLLVAIEVLIEGEPLEVQPKLRAAWRLVTPLLPGVALTVLSVLAQLSTETTRTESPIELRGVFSTLYGAWAEWFWAMTKWTIMTIVPCLALAYIGLRRLFRVGPAFFSPLATLVLAAAALSAPHVAFRWAYLSSRFIPFFWFALLLRVPEEIPRWLKTTLVMCAVTFSAGLGIEYTWLANDWKRVAAGEPFVPDRSRLLTLAFVPKGRHGDNTRPLTHVWGLYSMDRDAMSPSFFAHSRTFPITYVTLPPRQFEQLSIETFTGTMVTEWHFCDSAIVVPFDCAAAYRAAWHDFWRAAAKRFDHVLMVDPTPDVTSNIPQEFGVAFDRNAVHVLVTAPVP